MKRCSRGFSLVELIVVIAIIAIATGITTLGFNKWVKKANIEKQAKELFSDFNDARLQSVYMKKRHSMVLQPYSYVFKEYSSENENRLNGRVLSSKTVSYQMTKLNGTTSIADDITEFDIRGFTYDMETIRINPAYSGAAYDCVVVSEARTNFGRIEKVGSSDACVQK